MKEKKKKILNVRKSLIAGALVLTTALAGLGIHNSSINKQTEDPTQSSEPSSSQTIIDNNHSHNPELPGGIIIDPEVTDPVIEVPEVIEPIIKEPVETEKPISTPGIGENNNGTQTSNPGTVITDPTTPTETDPIITIPEHTHTLGEWVAINDIIEGSYCPDDGVLVKTRIHIYTITGKEVIPNNNGTHNIYITGECTNCGHSKTRIIENQDCNYENLTWDSVFEYETCEDCNYIYTVGKHAFDEGKIKGNQKLYSCENDGCEYTFSKPYNPNHNNNNNNGGGSNTDRPVHTHYYGEWISLNDELEANYCPEDGKLMGTRAHKYTQTDNKVISNNDGTHTIVKGETCANCNHKKTSTNSVSCEFGPEVLVGNQYVSTCGICGYEKTRPYIPSEHTHNWSEWKVTKPATCTEDGEETRTCSVDGCTVKVETRVIPALNHSYKESTSLVSNGDGTHDLIKTKTCGACGDVQTETISSGVSCTYNNIVEVTNDDGVVIQEIHSCDCGHSYTVDIDPEPDHTVHTPDSNGQYKRSGTDCCYETYYICGECGVEYGNSKVGHVEGAPDEAGVIQCEQCGIVLRVEEPELPELPELPAIPVIDEEEALEEIINNQEESLTDASNNADQKLEDLINSEADDETIDATLEEIIVEQEQAIADANASADQQLNETIANIENAKVEEIIASQDSTVAEARKNAEARLEEVLASDADPATKDAEVDRIIEETDKVIGLATAKADAELAALIGATPSDNAVRLLTK